MNRKSRAQRKPKEPDTTVGKETADGAFTIDESALNETPGIEEQDKMVFDPNLDLGDEPTLINDAAGKIRGMTVIQLHALIRESYPQLRDLLDIFNLNELRKKFIEKLSLL